MPSEGSGLRCGSIHNRSFVRLEEERSGAVALERPRDVARSVSVCLGWSFPDCQGGRCLYPQRLRKRQQAGALQTLRELGGAVGGRGGLPPLCRFVIRAELDPGHPTTELDGRLPRRLAVLDLRFGGRRFPSPTGLWRNEQYALLGLPLAHKDGVCALFGQGQGPFVRRLLKTSSARGAIALPQAPHKARMRSRRRTSSRSPSGLSAPPCSVITQSR
jgi:hypothetical protein